MKFDDLTDRLQPGPDVPDSAVGCAANDDNCINPPPSDDGSDPGTGNGNGETVIRPLEQYVIDTLTKGIILHPKGDPNSSVVYFINWALCVLTVIFHSILMLTF